MTEKKKVGEGASHHADERTEVSLSEICVKIPAALGPAMGAAVPLCSQLQEEAQRPAVLPPHGN